MDAPRPRPWALAALLLPAAGLLLLDLWEDLHHGGALAHALVEAVAVAAVAAAATWVLWAERRRVTVLQADLAGFRAALAARVEAAPAAPPGLAAEPALAAAPPPGAPAPPPASSSGTDVVDGQLRAWRLSPAEQEVAWLLLKGVSINDIGAARGTSPRTAQDQARAVYRKAGVSGRAELAAVLLEAAADPGA